MTPELLPGCQGDVEDILELYERVRARTGLAENTFNSKKIHYADFRSRLCAGRMTPRTMRSMYTKLTVLEEQYAHAS